MRFIIANLAHLDTAYPAITAVGESELNAIHIYVALHNAALICNVEQAGEQKHYTNAAEGVLYTTVLGADEFTSFAQLAAHIAEVHEVTLTATVQ